MRVWTARVLHHIKWLVGRTGILRLPFVDRLRSKRSTFTIDIDGLRLTAPKRFFPHFVLHEYEPITQQSFKDVLRPGMNVVDVGAHVGYYSMLSARLVGPAGRVTVVEPFHENLAFLRANLRDNGIDNVDVFPVAAGREEATRQFHVTGSSDSNGFFDHPMTETVEVIEVPERPLDLIVAGRVDAVKIDVEGAETWVLDGMRRIVADNPHVVLWVEWAPHCMRSAGLTPAALPDHLHRLGFDRIEVIDDAAGTRLPLDEVLPRVVAGTMGPNWYGNLLARKSAPAGH